jgi:DNA modification methylase
MKRTAIEAIVTALGDPPRVSVAPRSNLALPVYRWFNYKHSFSAEFTKMILGSTGLAARNTILDPFCGAGTALLAAQQCGIRSIGYDIMPLSILASSVKTARISVREARKAAKGFLGAVSSDESTTGFADWSAARPHLAPYLVGKQAEDVYRALMWVQSYMGSNVVRDWLLLALLSSLEDASCSVKGGAFLRHDATKHVLSVAQALEKRLSIMLTDLDTRRDTPRVLAEAVLADARDLPLPDQSVDVILTSPPYPNRHDYTRTYYLELAVGFQDDNQVKELRHHTICSHTEAHEPVASAEVLLEQGTRLNIDRISHSSAPDAEISQMLVAYFCDMTRSLKEMYRTLRPGGIAAIVVSEVQYSGVPIPVGEHLEHIGLECGFKRSRRVVLRSKGNSPQQMERYGRHKLSEELVLLEKE